jgi:hypothetical protein
MCLRKLIRKRPNLDNAGMISKIKESEATMNSVKGDPSAKVDSFTNIID